MLRAKSLATIAGRVSSIQDIKYADRDGTASLLFSVAVSQSRKKEDGTYEEMDPLFFDLSAYGGLAESINRSVHSYKDVTGKVGMPICIKAVITQYEKNGVKNQSLKVSEIVFMNAPKKTQKGVVLTNAFVKPVAEVEFAGRISMTKGIQTKGSTQYLQFSIAQERSVKNRETNRYDELEPYYWDLVAYGSVAKRLDNYISKYKAQYGSVGLEIVLKSSIATDVWEKEGVKHKKYSFKVNEIDYAASPRVENEQNSTASATQMPPVKKPDASFIEITEEEDELPFD